MKGKSRYVRDEERQIVLAELILVPGTTGQIAEEVRLDGLALDDFTVSRYLVGLRRNGLADFDGTWSPTEAAIDAVAA